MGLPDLVRLGFASFLLFPTWSHPAAHKYLNSTCRVFPRPLLDVIALAALESVQTRTGSGHAQVCHHRLHSKSLCCTRNDCVILGFFHSSTPSRARWPNSNSSSCLHDLITPVKYLPAFSSLFQLPRVGFAIFLHTSFAAFCTSDLSELM